MDCSQDSEGKIAHYYMTLVYLMVACALLEDAVNVALDLLA